MTTEEKFNQIYQRIIDENLADMEVARRDIKAKNWYNKLFLVIFLMIALAFAIVNIIVAVTNSETLNMILLCLIILGGILGYIYFKIDDRYGKPKLEKYTREFKTRIIGPMIKTFEEQLEFIPQDRIITKSI